MEGEEDKQRWNVEEKERMKAQEADLQQSFELLKHSDGDVRVAASGAMIAKFVEHSALPSFVHPNIITDL